MAAVVHPVEVVAAAHPLEEAEAAGRHPAVGVVHPPEVAEAEARLQEEVVAAHPAVVAVGVGLANAIGMAPHARMYSKDLHVHAREIPW